MPEEETPETDKRGPPQTAAGQRQKTADKSSQKWPENRAEQSRAANPPAQAIGI